MQFNKARHTAALVTNRWAGAENLENQLSYGRKDGQPEGRTNKWTDGWSDGRMDGRMDGRTDGRTDGRMVRQAEGPKSGLYGQVSTTLNGGPVSKACSQTSETSENPRQNFCR